jgi:hypothetical protein
MALHATLLPKLDGNCDPYDMTIADFLTYEHPAAMWHVYFDGCNAPE